MWFNIRVLMSWTVILPRIAHRVLESLWSLIVPAAHNSDGTYTADKLKDGQLTVGNIVTGSQRLPRWNMSSARNEVPL